ncbi:ROK family protein [Agromyces intestinalis]|nr:ROK family protein [Agromyces intestinalis]
MLHDGESTRAEIVRVTSLTSATVSSLLAQLIADGYVEDAGQAESTGGKRPTTLRINRHRHGILSIVARPRRLRGAVLDLTGTIVEVIERRLDHALQPSDVDAFTTELIGSTSLHPIAIALQVPGTTNRTEVLESVQLKWENVGLDSLLGSHAGIPAFLVNDADAGSIAEGVQGGDPSENSVFVHLGEGVGIAVMLAGRLLHGPAASAGEIGHVRVQFGEEQIRCRCGRYGCLEAVSSLAAMLGSSFSDDLEPDEIRSIVESAETRGIIELGALTLARTLQMVCATLNVRSIVIGGAGVYLGDAFIDVLNDELEHEPGRGATPPTARYAVNSDIFLGGAQYALAETLGVRWRRIESGDVEVPEPDEASEALAG